MNWFYANAGQQAGPVNDADFQRLAREGVIQPTTLVWREGMPQWEPFANVAAASPPMPGAPFSAAAAPANQVVCTECRKFIAIEETMQIGSATICAACKPNYLQKLREGAVPFTAATGEMRYAGFWIRVAAYVIDTVIMTIVSLPLTIWFNIKMQQALAIQGGSPDWAAFATYWALSTGWSIIISFLYGCIFVGRYAATPGKMLVKIKVVTGDGSRVSYLRALARQGGHILNAFTCMIGYLLPLFDDQKRALHDHIANTRVVYK